MTPAIYRALAASQNPNIPAWVKELARDAATLGTPNPEVIGTLTYYARMDGLLEADNG